MQDQTYTLFYTIIINTNYPPTTVLLYTGSGDIIIEMNKAVHYDFNALTLRGRGGRVSLSVGLATGWSRVRIPLRQLRFRTLAILVTPLCRRCLSEETLKAVGSFYPVSMPGEVKYSNSLHWKCVTCRGLHHS